MTSAVQSSHCCSHFDNSPKGSLDLMRVLERVSSVVLGIFSAKASPALFTVSFFAGLAIGLSQKIEGSNAHQSSSYSAGFMEQITGVKALPIVSLLANVSITYYHIDHHTLFFVPMVGIHLGMSAGQFFKDRVSHLS